MAGADVVDQVIADSESAGDCKKARRLQVLKEKYRNKICVKLALRTP